MFFFELFQIAIGKKKQISKEISDSEWNTLYNVCKKQLVLGVAFSAIQKLPEEQRPSLELFAKWQKDAQIEQERRERIIEICRKACETHEKNGFDSCVLMPTSVVVRGERLEVRDEIGEFRGGDPKDIDILCWSKDKKDGKRTIVEYVNFQYVSSTHHIKPKVVRNFTDIESGNIPMEVRFKSDYLNCPWYNSRFEAWVREMVDREQRPLPPPSPVGREPEGDNISTLKNELCEFPIEFFVVYQLLHLYRKLFCEGIRLGHMLEYYYTLQKFSVECLEFREKRGEVMQVIERLGMKKFAGAVMYVLQTVFAMPDEYLICKSDARHGSFVLNITMMAGEYTRYIERTRTLSHLGRIGHHLYWLKRNRPFITQYPVEMFFDLYKRMKG